MKLEIDSANLLDQTKYWASSLARQVFSTAGHLSRIQFAFGSFLTIMIARIGPDQRDSGPIIGLFYLFFALYVSLVIYSKRLHDFGASSLWLMVIGVVLTLAKSLAIPYLAVAMFISGPAIYNLAAKAAVFGASAFWIGLSLYLLVKAGDAGANRFGVKPGHGILQTPVGDF